MGNGLEVKISDKAFDAAIKRHEDAFDKELSEVDVKKIVLKTKKAVLEQARSNEGMKSTITELRYEMSVVQQQVNSFDGQLSELRQQLANTTEVFKNTITLLEAHPVEKKGFLRLLWAWIF